MSGWWDSATIDVHLHLDFIVNQRPNEVTGCTGDNVGHCKRNKSRNTGQVQHIYGQSPCSSLIYTTRRVMYVAHAPEQNKQFTRISQQIALYVVAICACNKREGQDTKNDGKGPEDSGNTFSLFWRSTWTVAFEHLITSKKMFCRTYLKWSKSNSSL